MNDFYKNSYLVIVAVIFAVMVGVAGCAGGYGSSEPGAGSAGDTPTFKAESGGQQLLLERTQKRNVMDTKTQVPDVPVPVSAAKRSCEGFPGFDRGCPGGGK